MRKRTNLNYDWLFKEKFEESDLKVGNFNGFSKIDLPHTQKLMPYNYFDLDDYLFVSTYKKLLNVKKEPNKSYIISFLGIAQRSEIYLNGIKLNENKCGYNQIDLDITKELKDGDNELTVVVSSKEENFPPFGFWVDYLGYGGIYREVYLYETGEDYITDPFLYTTNLLNENRKWNFRVNFKNNDSHKVNLLVKDSKTEVINSTFVAKSGEEVSDKLGEVELWDLDNPKLYDVEISLLNDRDKVIDSVEFKYGFREVKGDRKGFYLNGKKVLIRGLDRHQSWPYVGYAMPVSMQRRDAQILKYKLGCNCMRMSHYMNHPEFLNECDRIGLLVYEEFPGWQHIGDDSWKAQAMSNLDSMILRDRNHASIAFFGVRINESKTDIEFNKACYKRAKELDPSRIITGTHANAHEKDVYDCYSYNNFWLELTPKVLFKKRQVTNPKNPYLITEYCGHMHPNKPYDSESRRVDTAKIHAKIIEKVEKEGDLFGAMGWVMADYNTHKFFGVNDMICYHGVLDMNRNEKVTSYVYQALRDKKYPFLEVDTDFAEGEYDASRLYPPRIYTNCDKVEVYKDGKYLNEYNIKGNSVKDHIITVYDFVGNELVEEFHESERYQKSFKKTLKYLLDHSYNNLVALFFHSDMIHVKKNLKYGEHYMRGITRSNYELKGYIDGTQVATKYIAFGALDHLDITSSSDSFDVEDTYDVVSVTVTAKNKWGNTLIYLPDVVEVSYSDGLELIGPAKLSLIGGNATFYFKNKNNAPSKEFVEVKSDRCEIVRKDLLINIK